TLGRTGSEQRRPRPMARVTPRRPPQARQPCAEQAVAAHEMMVEKTERAIGRKRRQPQRQARQLYSHGVEVHTEQTALGNRPSNGRALDGAEIVRAMTSRSKECALERLGQKGARTDEEGPASH